MLNGWGLEVQSSGKVLGTGATADSSLQMLEQAFAKQGDIVRSILCVFTPTADATNINQHITRMTLLAGGARFWDMPMTYFAALFTFMGKKAEFSNAQPWTEFPLHMWRQYSAPPNVNLSLTLAKDATMGTTTAPTLNMYLAWNQRDPSMGYAYCLSQKYGVPVSANPFSVNPSQPGILQYIILGSLTHVTGLVYYDDRGQRTQLLDPNALYAFQELYQGVEASSFPLSTPFCFKVPEERSVVSGSTRIDFYTDSSYVDQEVGLVTYFPSPYAVQQMKAGKAA
jgi:hypothetical protein